MFQENSAQLSICFHGNDHTQGEFESTDEVLLNSLLFVAEKRMAFLEQNTGLKCDRVMAFPQGRFSREAMKVLRAHNFCAAVNAIPYPVEEVVQLTFGELAQPAVLRYEGFPLFLRECIGGTKDQDIAFNLFFGRPVLIVEHHDLFENPESLVEIAGRINSMAPELNWCNLATAAANSILRRKLSDGTYHVRAYSSTVRIVNNSGSVQHYLIEWASAFDCPSVDQVLIDGTPFLDFQIDNARPRISAELAPGASQTFSLVHRKDQSPAIDLGVRWKVKAFVRRRLSEFRDDYLSKNPRVLEAAKAFQRRFLRV